MAYNPNFRGNTGSAAKLVRSGYQNSLVSTITKTTPVSVNTSGQLVLLDVSDETNVFRWVGVAAEDIPAAANGQVSGDGRIENITTSLSVGDFVYAGKTPGTLINTKPDIGIMSFASGDFVVLIGVIVKNEFNPLQKDLKLVLLNIGQL